MCVLIRHVCVCAYYCCVDTACVCSYCACYYISVLLSLSDMLARYTLRMLMLSILRVLLYEYYYMCGSCVDICVLAAFAALSDFLARYTLGTR